MVGGMASRMDLEEDSLFSQLCARIPFAGIARCVRDLEWAYERCGGPRFRWLRVSSDGDACAFCEMMQVREGCNGSRGFKGSDRDPSSAERTDLCEGGLRWWEPSGVAGLDGGEDGLSGGTDGLMECEVAREDSEKHDGADVSRDGAAESCKDHQGFAPCGEAGESDETDAHDLEKRGEGEGMSGGE